MTIPYEEITATGWLEFQRGEKYWIISTNCKIKIEIRVKDLTPSHQTSIIPVSTTSTLTSTTTSTMTSTATSTSITSERNTESQSHFSGNEKRIREISKHDDTNDVETRDAARIQETIDVSKINCFSLEFSLGGFSGIGLTMLVISIFYFARRIFLCVRNRRRLERERMRGDSLATDLSYQPQEIFA